MMYIVMYAEVAEVQRLVLREGPVDELACVEDGSEQIHYAC